SAPRVLAPLPAGVSQGLPAVASTSHAWHVLVYEATAEETCVRIYSAAHSDERFQPSRELLRRRISSEDIYLHGNYQLRRSGDIAIVGDYVGLAGAGDRLAAAVVMP